MTTYDCRKKTTEKVINEIKALNLDNNTEINIIYFNGNNDNLIDANRILRGFNFDPVR